MRNKFTVELIEIYRKMYFSRVFEDTVAVFSKSGKIKVPVYLSAGQEAVSAALSLVLKDYAIFTQHRNHSTYLSFGGSPESLVDELLCKDTGCNHGICGSPMIQDQNIKMFGHNGLIGENVPVAVGYALGSGSNTICFFGDGAAEEDYIGPSLGFAATHNLPILFVCEDNGLSILTKTRVRRCWNIADVAEGYGLSGNNFIDDPLKILKYAKNIKLPALINCKVQRNYWHCGFGVDGPPEYDRLKAVKYELDSFEIDTNIIEEEILNRVNNLWK
jgi:acetoin:2,6-dichlorophenolindophenol oxidoreductase subunit alpha